MAAVMKAGKQATNAVLDENSAANPTFKRVYDQWRPFRNDPQLRFSVNVGAAEPFLYANRERS